jgi:hypothetical protein
MEETFRHGYGVVLGQTLGKGFSMMEQTLLKVILSR